MSRPICRECEKGHHSICSGDRSPTIVMTCQCRYCKSWVDEHGPFSKPKDEVDD